MADVSDKPVSVTTAGPWVEWRFRWIDIDKVGPLTVERQWGPAGCHSGTTSACDMDQLALMLGRSILGCLDEEVVDGK